MSAEIRPQSEIGGELRNYMRSKLTESEVVLLEALFAGKNASISPATGMLRFKSAFYAANREMLGPIWEKLYGGHLENPGTTLEPPSVPSALPQTVIVPVTLAQADLDIGNRDANVDPYGVTEKAPAIQLPPRPTDGGQVNVAGISQVPTNQLASTPGPVLVPTTTDAATVIANARERLLTMRTASGRRQQRGCRSRFVGLFLSGITLMGGAAAANAILCKSDRDSTMLSSIDTKMPKPSPSMAPSNVAVSTKTSSDYASSASSPSVIAIAVPARAFPSIGFGVSLVNSVTPVPSGTVFTIPSTIITPPTVASATTSANIPSTPIPAAAFSGASLPLAKAAPTPIVGPHATTDVKKPGEPVVALSTEAKELFEKYPEFNASDVNSETIRGVIDSFAASERLKALLQDEKIKLLPGGASLLGQIFNEFHKIASTPEQHAYFYFLENVYFVGEKANTNPKSAYAENNKAALELYKFVNKGLAGIVQEAKKTVSLDEHLQSLIRLAIRPFLSDFPTKKIYKVFANWLTDHPQVLAEMDSPYGTTWKYTDTNSFIGVSKPVMGVKTNKKGTFNISPETLVNATPKAIAPSEIIEVPASQSSDYSPPKFPSSTKAPGPSPDSDLPSEYQNVDGHSSVENGSTDLPIESTKYFHHSEDSSENTQAEAFISTICANLQPPKGEVVYTYIAKLCKKHFGTENYSMFAPLVKELRASKGTCFADVWRMNDKGKRIKRGGDRSFVLSPEFKARFKEIAKKILPVEVAEPFELVPRAEPFELVTQKTHDAFPLVTRAAEPFELVEEPILLVNKKLPEDIINVTNAAVGKIIEEKRDMTEQPPMPVNMIEQDPFAADADPFPSTPIKKDSGIYTVAGASQKNGVFMPEPEQEPVLPDNPDDSDEPPSPDEPDKTVVSQKGFFAKAKAWLKGEKLAA